MELVLGDEEICISRERANSWVQKRNLDGTGIEMMQCSLFDMKKVFADQNASDQ